MQMSIQIKMHMMIFCLTIPFAVYHDANYYHPRQQNTNDRKLRAQAAPFMTPTLAPARPDLLSPPQAASRDTQMGSLSDLPSSPYTILPPALHPSQPPPSDPTSPQPSEEAHDTRSSNAPRNPFSPLSFHLSSSSSFQPSRDNPVPPVSPATLLTTRDTALQRFDNIREKLISLQKTFHQQRTKAYKPHQSTIINESNELVPIMHPKPFDAEYERQIHNIMEDEKIFLGLHQEYLDLKEIAEHNPGSLNYHEQSMMSLLGEIDDLEQKTIATTKLNDEFE